MRQIVKTREEQQYHLQHTGRLAYNLRLAWKMKYLYILLLPAILYFCVFHYKPMYGIVLAFKTYRVRRGVIGSPWATPWYIYFDQLFNSFSFWEVTRNTIEIYLLKLAFGFPAPILLALFLNELRNQKVKKTFQTISYLPHFLSWVVLGPIIRNVFSLNGPINTVIQAFGGEAVYFISSNEWFRTVLVSSGIWSGVGWASIIYLAAIAGVDTQLYESAMLDGATKREQAWHITLPSIRPIIIIQLIMGVGNLLEGGFDQTFNLYSPIVYKVADILPTYIYRQGIVSGNYSYTTAVGLFQNVVGLIMLVITNFITKKLNDGEGCVW